MRLKMKTLSMLLILGLFFSVRFVDATIFAALRPSIEKAREVKKNVTTASGIAKVDESKKPPEIAVGEIKALWNGHWQLGGGKLDIDRAQATTLLFPKNITSFKFKVRWVGGNEAVAQPAKHEFLLTVYKVEGGKETKVEEVRKQVEVGGKGLGGTAFKKGNLYSSAITAEKPGSYRLVMKAKNSNTGASLDTYSDIQIQRESPEGIVAMGCERTQEFKKYDRCWGWHQTHTYDLGKVRKLTFLKIEVTAGPSESKGKKYKGWRIEGSADGKSWRKILDMNTVAGEKSSSIFDTSGQPEVRYIRINTLGKGYVDWSKADFWIL